MKKVRADDTHPEWYEAVAAFVFELDMPDREVRPIRSLLGPGPVRVFMSWWLAQDAEDPKILVDPFSQSDDPEWWQIDGNPAQGGTQEDILTRKWDRRAGLYFQFFGPHVWHVVDWLIVAQQRSQPWLQNLDERGEPKKLLKCRSIDDLVREADKGLRHRNSGEKVVLGTDDEVFVADLGVGHMLVHLKSPIALRHEGNRMHHCVGQGGYDKRLGDDGYLLLSVRDPAGKPLATIEIVGDDVRQIRGPRNASPADHLLDLLSPFAGNWQMLVGRAAGEFAADENGPQNNDNRRSRRV